MSLLKPHSTPADPVIEIAGRDVPLRLVRNKRAKRLILRVEHSTGEVVVVGPSDRSLRKALQFAEKERAWIETSLAKVPHRLPFEPGASFPFQGQTSVIVHTPQARRGILYDASLGVLFVSGDREFVPRRVQDWLKARARETLTAHVKTYTDHLNIEMPKVSIRDTTTRWGSCSPMRTLSFSWRLILADPVILSYVAAHEVAHLTHMNHSKVFWSLVEELFGPYDAEETWLKVSGSELHRYGVIGKG
jgi:predicted metal-dependent hydrolase